MIIQSTPLSYLVEFTNGTVVGSFTYNVTNDAGTVLHGPIIVTPPAGSVSYLIQIPSSVHALTNPLLEGRSLSWSYTSTNGPVSDIYSYVVRKRIPFPATADGVRQKLGIDISELKDTDIDLFSSYIQFKELFTADIDTYAVAGTSTTLKIINAIEAIAALKLLPILQISLAKRLASGTNEYERWNKPDWELIRGYLDSLIIEATLLVDPTLTFDIVPIFTLSIRTDPFTGA